MDSVKVINNVSESETKQPINLEQTRPLSKLEPAQQREAWQKAVETAPEGKVAAAQIEQNVSGCTKVHLGTIPETHLRPLAKLTPEKQREAYQQAVETAPDG